MIVSCEFGVFFFFGSASEAGSKRIQLLQDYKSKSISPLFCSTLAGSILLRIQVMSFKKKKNYTNFKHFPAFLRCNLPFIIHLYVRDLLRYQTDSTYLFGWACVYL